jgi:hypothetical protein
MSLKPASYYLRHADELRAKAQASTDRRAQEYYRRIADEYAKQAEIAARFEAG